MQKSFIDSIDLRFLAVILILWMCSEDVLAQQRFRGSLFAGVNLAQIDGDDLAGYNKPGLSAGVRVAYPTGQKTDLSLELAYSVRGSRRSLFGGGDQVNTTLNYIEIPLIFSYKDWEIPDEKYFKVKAEGGLAYGYLFDVESFNSGYTTETLKNFDITYLLGVSFNFTKRLGLTVRYNRSLNDLLPGEGRLVGYFVTSRLDFNF